MRRVASRVARTSSVWTCALREGGSLEDVFEPRETTTGAETAARALRVKLVDEICRGRPSRGRRGVEEGGGRGMTARESDDARAARVGEATRRAAAAANGDGEEENDDDVARVEAVVAFVLEYCAEILRPTNGERAAMPPLGTHVIRRAALASDATMSAYFQEQCSFDASSPTTADHFIDGERQRVHASAKISVRPRVVSVGSTVVVHLDAPPPSERARARGVRDGCCFVEFRGCSGHPDHLGRRRSTTPDEDSEVFEFNLPSIRITGLARGWPTAELVGDVFVRSTTTSTAASLKFREFDVDSSPSFRNIVSGTIASDSKTVKRLILGTWDTRVLLGGVSRDDARAERRINLRVDDAPPPLTTATGIQSVLPALRDPAVMTNRRLWQAIVEAMRAAKIREPERSATREILGETPPVAVAEKLAEGARMTYELAVIVADAPPEDEEPPLPRYWNPHANANANAEERRE